MTLQEYLDSIHGKTVAVVGIGVSNTPLLRLLLREGVAVTACDKRTREQLGELAGELEQGGARLQLGSDYLEGLDQDIIFRTPGLRPDVPQLAKAVAGGSVLTSEMEVFFQVCPCPIIAVTGSDGKTTTTTLIAEMLRAAGRTVWLGGNIGTPLLDKAGEMKKSDIAVLELSSFQLMSMTRSPHIAVITNLSPNHLDVHKDMEEYVWAKGNIYRHQGADDLLVLNYDNALTRAQAGDAPGKVRFFSRQSGTAEGLFLQDGFIADARGPILNTKEIRIPGDHNVENYMAACAALRDLVEPEIMARVSREFSGVEHRLELCRDKDGVRWYNDSIASSPTRTLAGLRCFPEKVILIAGGYDKHIPFTPLGEEIPRSVKTLILCGATADKIRAATLAAPDYAPGNPHIRETESLADAVKLAHSLAKPGDVVLFSPACASFDQFPNFMVRGRFFKENVANL